MKVRIIILSLIMLITIPVPSNPGLAAPSSQSESGDVIQIVLVLDVSGSMGTPVYSGIVPEDLLSLLLRMREVQADPDYIDLNGTLEAAKEDPAVAAAELDWNNAFDAMSNYVADTYGQSIPEARNQVRTILEDAGCEGYLDQAISTAGSFDQVASAVIAACPSGAATTELRQSINALVPYVQDSGYLALRQIWTDAALAYDEALETAGFPSAQQLLDDFRAGVGMDNLQDEIDRLTEAYNIPTRLGLAQSAAINLIDLSQLDEIVTGRESVIGLVAFSTEAFLEHGLTTDHEALKSIIRKWTPQEQTNIGDALSIGLNELSGADTEQPMLVILLSDGHANVGMLSPEILAAIPPRANAMDATICTAGFADFEAEVDVVLLDGLAEQTEGEYLFTNSGEELGSFFIACREAVVGRDLLGQLSGIVEASDRSPIGSAEVPQNTCELSLAMNFLSGTPLIHLTDPEAAVVDPTAEGVFYQRGDNVQLFSVRDPMAGEWTIDVSNDDLEGEMATFSVVISAQACEGDFSPIDETTQISDLPFLLTEEGMPVVTAVFIVIVLVSGVGVFLIIRKRQKGLL